MRVVVTGGSGKGGAWVVRDLRDHGHDVLNVDIRHDGSAFGLCMVADLTDLGQAQDALAGADAIVHFAAIPAPGSGPRARRSGSMPCRPTTSSPRRWRTTCGGSCGRRRRRCSGSRSTSRRPSPRSTRPSSRVRSRRIRCPSSSARRWQASSPGGARSTSSACGSRTSWSPPTTRPSLRGRTTRRSASGTCGATSTPGTLRRQRDSRSTRRSKARRSASWRPPTR